MPHTNKIAVTINRELLEDAEQCARKCGMNLTRFVSEMVESALAERRLAPQSHIPAGKDPRFTR
jgi:hypothetical protein